MKFGEMLVREGIVSPSQLRTALDRQVVFGGRIGTNLVELGILREIDLTTLLSRFLRIPAMDADINSIPDEVIQCFSPELADRYRVLPFKRARKRLHAGIADVQDASAIDELKFKSGFDIIPYVVSEIRLLYGLEKYYGIKRDLRYISIFSGESGKTEGEDAAGALKKVKEAFISATTRAEVTGPLMSEARKVASRTILFAVKDTVLEPLAAYGLSRQGHSMEIDPSSLISQVLLRKNYYRGPLPDIPGNRPLIELLHGAAPDCLILPVGIREKTVLILYADNGPGAVLHGNLNYLHDLAKMASLALEILILRKKIADL